MNITIPPEELERLRRKFDSVTFRKKIDEALEAASAELEADVVKNINEYGITNTGRLAQSIYSRKIDDLTYEVATDVRYAPFVEYGTRPHYPNYQSIYVWVGQKLGIHGKSQSQVAWAVVNKIAQKGTEARNYFKDAYENFDFKQTIDRLERSWAND